MNIVLLLFVHTFSARSNKILCDVFSGFDRVLGRCVSISLYNLFPVASFSYMSHNSINCIFLICIAIDAWSVY